MNGAHVSEYRLGWTSESLNFTLPLQKSIGDLRISHANIQNKQVSGTSGDVAKLVEHITKKTGLNNSALTSKKIFDATFWYTHNPLEHNITRPSDGMEEAYAKIGDWYLKHQKFIFEDPENFAVSDDDNYEFPDNADDLLRE